MGDAHALEDGLHEEGKPPVDEHVGVYGVVGHRGHRDVEEGALALHLPHQLDDEQVVEVEGLLPRLGVVLAAEDVPQVVERELLDRLLVGEVEFYQQVADDAPEVSPA